MSIRDWFISSSVVSTLSDLLLFLLNPLACVKDKVRRPQFSCDWGTSEDDGMPYMRDQCQRIKTAGQDTLYFKFYCDELTRTGTIANYDSDDDTCSGTPISKLVLQESYLYQCNFGNNETYCNPFNLTYFEYFGSPNCQGQSFDNFSVILTPVDGCRQITPSPAAISRNYTFSSNNKYNNGSSLKIDFYEFSKSCEFGHFDHITYYFSNGCQLLASNNPQNISAQVYISYDG